MAARDGASIRAALESVGGVSLVKAVRCDVAMAGREEVRENNRLENEKFRTPNRSYNNRMLK